jgi:hypothetical protein
MVPLEQSFLLILASVPFGFATYGYWVTFWKRSYYRSQSCSEDPRGSPVFPIIALLVIPAILPTWYGAAALYLALPVLTTGKFNGCLFWQSPGYRKLVGLGTLAAISSSFWPGGANAFAVMLVFGLVALIGAEALKYDSARNKEKANKRVYPTHKS